MTSRSSSSSNSRWPAARLQQMEMMEAQLIWRTSTAADDDRGTANTSLKGCAWTIGPESRRWPGDAVSKGGAVPSLRPSADFVRHCVAIQSAARGGERARFWLLQKRLAVKIQARARTWLRDG
mmetsp:Transcript_36077/g.116140  ORF Transcript_36077/g.116140 Transcript_36077/m.116140 type:complete len:123 (-) Transcript_36077:289-657(-)